MSAIITKNIRSSIEVAEIPEGCLMGNEGVDKREDTTNIAIGRLDDAVGSLVAALETCAVGLPDVDVEAEPVTDAQIDTILTVTERMAKINEALRTLGESKTYLNSLEAVVSRKW